MTTTDYDLVDYGGHAQFHTSPNLIGGMGRLLGVDCAEPSRARVLELGCGNAANLIPLAWYWPDAEFVGIDLAATPIAQGTAQLKALGLRNLTLAQGDVAELSVAHHGQFDYVIAHGLFSWVPPFVREATLRLIRAVLKPGGLAYVSYNAYPGCRVRHLVRELSQFHAGGRPTSLDTADRAWHFLEGAAAIPAPQHPAFYRDLMHGEVRDSLRSGVNFLFHDDLAENNQPFYLHEFSAQADAAGLRYVGDIFAPQMFEPEGSPELSRWLDDSSAGDWMRRHQYLDFLIGSRFRRTLVCRDDEGVPAGIVGARLDELPLMSELEPRGPLNPGDESEASFVDATGRNTITTASPLLKSVLLLLSLSPTRTLRVAQLAERMTDVPRDRAMANARDVLLRMLRNGMVQPLRQDPPACLEVDPSLPEVPALSPLSRYLIETDQTPVDNLHRKLFLTVRWLRELLLALDGRRDTATLRALAFRLARQEQGLADDAELNDGLYDLVRGLARRGLCIPATGQTRSTT